jgi:hypothetical protein
MMIFLSDISALESWRAANPRTMAVAPASDRWRTDDYLSHSPSVEERAFADLSRYGIRTRPVRLLVPDASRRIRSSKAVTRVWRGPVPPGSFRRIREGLYLCSPELVFLQMAGTLDLLPLIELGFELCGFYALRDDFREGFMTRAIPLATVESLSRYVESAAGARGRRNACRALRYVMERSRSPMETIEAMLFCLPSHLGGKGCPRPRLNRGIPLVGLARELAKRSSVECDVLWEEAGVDVEYDSYDNHATPDQLARDATKRAALDRLGIDVYTMTYAQLRDVAWFDAFTHMLAEKAGWRLPAPVADFKAKEASLRSALLPHGRARW